MGGGRDIVTLFLSDLNVRMTPKYAEQKDVIYKVVVRHG